MKKLTTIFLAMLMAFAFAACSGNNGKINLNPSSAESPSNAASSDTSAQNSSAVPDNSQTGDSSRPATDNSADAGKILVAYFSATHTTEGVAKTISDILGADLYEITPEQPYTDADLNYHDDQSRSTIEMNDPDARPAIAGSAENMDQYDIVFLGYPIWWGEAPRILSTFVESYDFSGKTIVPFCTSGGSGVGSSAKNLENLSSGAAWLSGTRLDGGASRSSIEEWIDGLELDIAAQ